MSCGGNSNNNNDDDDDDDVVNNNSNNNKTRKNERDGDRERELTTACETNSKCSMHWKNANNVKFYYYSVVERASAYTKALKAQWYEVQPAPVNTPRIYMHDNQLQLT